MSTRDAERFARIRRWNAVTGIWSVNRSDVAFLIRLIERAEKKIAPGPTR